MPKMTAKFRGALETARRAEIEVDAATQDGVYLPLNEAGYEWDSQAGEWQHLASVPAEPPTAFVRVRVWAAAEVVEEVASEVVERLRSMRLHLVEPPSRAYPCRPPKQLEARVYLTFIPEGFLNRDALTLAEMEAGR